MMIYDDVLCGRYVAACCGIWSKQPCHQLASARPLSYRRRQQYSPAHIAVAPSRLTSSFVKQAPPLTTAADD
eukprot:scaffold3197_cov123-Skeletonema_marinoi.AAC.6